MNLFDALVIKSGMDFRNFLSEYRRAAALLYEKTGDLSFRNVALTEKSYARWRSGQVTRPHHPAPAILRELFGRPLDELFAPYTDEQAQALRTATAPVFDESELAMTARDARAHASDAAAQLLPDLTLDQLEDDLVGLVQDTSTKPPHLVFVSATEVLGVSKALLDRTQVLSQRRRLYLVAGQASALLSACAFDLGAIPHAFELARAAALYGQVAEYGPLQAYAHSYLAVLYYWTGKPAQAVGKIEEARSFPDVGATGKARLAAIAARAYAHRGRAEDAQLAIGESLVDRGPAEDDLHGIGGEFDFDLERVAMSNSSTLLLLQDGPGAETSARRSLELIAARSTSSSPLVVAPQARADLASALLMRNDLDGAAEALSPVLGLPREWRGAGLTARVNTIQAALASPAFRDARLAQDLAERIEAFTLVATPQVLGPGAVRLALGGSNG
ncbi:hypothetical protein [Streptomyces sp. LS1784]|uniref:hypothetical protein n=1 Tax=Streptomyces sp. LS1784 TaxID=2851533 RepID=UPI001CCC92E6|nr:hypothetical protein [Streptomyces sp. LS1784]